MPLMDGDGGIRWLYILIIVLLMLAAAFFAGSETAFSYCNKTRFKSRSEDGDKKAKRVQYILDHFDNTIITVLIGTNISHIVMSTLATIVAVAFLGGVGSLVSTIVITLLVFIFCETLPKNIARVNADRWAQLNAIPIIGLMYLFLPLVWVFSTPFNYIARKFGKKNNEPDITEEDLQTIVETIEEEGVLDEDESNLIQSAIEFDDIAVKEVYTPTKDIIAVNLNQSRDEIIKVLLNEDKFSRLPVYSGTIDNIIGILPVRKCLKELLYNKKISLKSIMSKPYFVAPGTKLDDILEGFSKHRTHMAIVMDKKKTIGIITMDDVLDELVGDIVEEDAEVGDQHA